MIQKSFLKRVLNTKEPASFRGSQVLHEDHWAFPRQTSGVSRRWEHPGLTSSEVGETTVDGWEFTEKYGMGICPVFS